MNKLIEFLSWDHVAKRYGCGLNPKLRLAIEADLQFPAHAASPRLQHPMDPMALPANIVPLSVRRTSSKRRQA